MMSVKIGMTAAWGRTFFAAIHKVNAGSDLKPHLRDRYSGRKSHRLRIALPRACIPQASLPNHRRYFHLLTLQNPGPAKPRERQRGTPHHSLPWSGGDPIAPG